jgi:anti-sigma regulatory factor (Ser/Thr protein kinase)
MPQLDQITLTLPREREFHRVAQLVLGGLAVRLELTIETLEDLQLGLEAVLDRLGPGGEITVSMSLDDGRLETCIGPVDLAAELDGDGLSLGRILNALVDEVKLDGDRVRLIKKIEKVAVG